MASIVVSLFHSFRFLVRSSASLHLEIVALRHQLAVVNRCRRPRLRFTTVDRLLWAWLSQRWHGWRAALHVGQPATVLAWHQRGFRVFWTWKSRHRFGRPGVPADVHALIREMSTMNPLWGAPRIHDELQKLGISVSQFNAVGLRRVVAAYIACYLRSRTHLALGEDTPNPRPVTPPSAGRIVAIPRVGGLHHRYDRIAA